MLVTATLNAMTAAATDLITHASLHTGDPSTSGANEVSGGSPAYARKAVTWSTPSAGASGFSATVTFDVPPATSVSHFGLWSAATSGTFRGGGALSATEAYVGQGQYDLTTVTITTANA